MSSREIAVILLNIQLDMDYADCKQYGKETVDILEKEIEELRGKDSSLFHILENISEENKGISVFVDGTEEE